MEHGDLVGLEALVAKRLIGLDKSLGCLPYWSW